MPAKYELLKTEHGKFHFNLKSPNGQIILSSQQYSTKTNAQGGVDAVRANAGNAARYDRKTSSKGEPFFTLKAANGEVLGRSEMYSTATAMEKGIESVKSNGPGAPVTDLTE